MPENDLLKKIEFYVNTLSEVEDNKTTTYVLEYYKDKNIDFIERDISIKVAIAKIYSTITTKHPEFNKQNKINTYKMILLLTMGYNDISSVNSLTDEIKRDIFEEYTSKILPILN